MIAAGLLVWTPLKSDPMPALAGRPLTDWVNEVKAEANGFGEEQTANNVLFAAAPRIIPGLSRLLLQRESAWIKRLPAAWIPERISLRYDDQLRMKANASWINSVIAYRNPNCPESRGAVPSLTVALNSRNSRVRYISAQALAAIGTAASNGRI
jgi:hypothetical protein